MKRKQVWRYYCDFCGKGGCSGGHMKRHEGSCCRNPNRVCRMCIYAKIGDEQKPMPELIEALGNGSAQGVERLRSAAQGCPVCMLAAIIQSKLQRPYDTEGDPGFHIEFDFKKEKDAYMQEVNSLKDEGYY